MVCRICFQHSRRGVEKWLTWENMISEEGSCEIDMWPDFQNLAAE